MKKLVIYRNETLLHMGDGAEGNYVDMPIQREKTTGFPKGEAAGIKGVMRSLFTGKDREELFGRISQDNDNDEGSEMGKLIFSDARLLFLPVKADKNKLFVWITCPYVLQRFCREVEYTFFREEKFEFRKELKNMREKLMDLNEETFLPLNGTACGEDDSVLILGEIKLNIKKNVKEELKFPVEILGEKEGYIQKKLNQDLYMVNDTIFSYFCENATEVITRIRIGEDGVVEDGALFTEEFLPENTILYNFISDVKEEGTELEEKLLKMLEKTGNMIQLGGGKTIGKGITSLHINPGLDAEKKEGES